MRTETAPRVLLDFLQDEAGNAYVTTSFLMVTLVASVPLGMMFYEIYEGLCRAGWSANLIIGLF